MATTAAPPPYIISWNITRRCGLFCEHCYMESTPATEDPAEKTEAQALAIIDEIAAFSPSAMLILTGGEPLLVPHILSIISHAAARGLTVFLGTNGTLIDAQTALLLKSAGTGGIGLSLDSTAPALHDAFRGMPGAWHKTVAAMGHLRAAGLPFQVQFTVTEKNRAELNAMTELALREKARALNVFFMVCTGRASAAPDLSAESYEAVLSEIAEASARYEDRLMVRARCAPQFLRVVQENTPYSPILRGGTSGCIAGEAYMRIDPTGRVTPCPYIPPGGDTPRLGEKSLREIWETDPAFVSIRECAPESRCAQCAYTELCKGCRARALALDGDAGGPDPSCAYERKDNAAMGDAIAEPAAPLWTEEARERLARVPRFLRPMVSRGVERYARHMRIKEITPEIMTRLRSRARRKD